MSSTPVGTDSDGVDVSSSRFLSKYPRQHMQEGSQIKVGVLGATGTVGQRFLTLLSSHPWFTIDAIGASSRSANQKYYKVVKWKQTTPIPAGVRDMIVKECLPANFSDCDIVFSGLDADVAGDIGRSQDFISEPGYANAFSPKRPTSVPPR